MFILLIAHICPEPNSESKSKLKNGKDFFFFFPCCSLIFTSQISKVKNGRHSERLYCYILNFTILWKNTYINLLKKKFKMSRFCSSLFFSWQWFLKGTILEVRVNKKCACKAESFFSSKKQSVFKIWILTLLKKFVIAGHFAQYGNDFFS